MRSVSGLGEGSLRRRGGRVVGTSDTVELIEREKRGVGVQNSKSLRGKIFSSLEETLVRTPLVFFIPSVVGTGPRRVSDHSRPRRITP